MQYRDLGRTGIKVSEVSFGSHLTRVNAENPEVRAKQIHAGLDQGINLFDIYEHSYKQFGPMSAALSDVIDKVVISLVTVWRAADEVADEVEYALDMFNREYIDLYRVVLQGNWEDTDPRMEALLKAKEQGKIRAVGGVVHYPENILEGLRRYPLEYIMAPANFFAPRAVREDMELVPALRKANTGLIIMKPMGAADAEGGHIFKLKPTDPELDTLKEKGLSLAKLAIKFLLQSETVSTVLPTMNSVEQVLENVQASGDGPLTEDEERFLQIYTEEARKSFGVIVPERDYWITPWKVE